MGTIVVGVDGSGGSVHALHFAVAEAALRSWDVRAVLAWGFLDQHHLETAEGFDADYVAADADRALRGYLDAALGAEAAAEIDRVVVNDLATPALLDRSRNADLLVLGARGLGGFRGLLLGSVSKSCLHRATCPIAIVRPPDDQDPDVPPRIIVGVDGSDDAARALRWAIAEAAARDAVLEAVHAWQPPFIGGYPFTAATVDYSMFEDSAHALIEGVVRDADTAALTKPVEQTVVCGGPASAILEASRRADLIVMGARGLGAVSRFLLGSVSDQVATHASTPVVVVPPPHDD